MVDYLLLKDYFSCMKARAGDGIAMAFGQSKQFTRHQEIFFLIKHQNQTHRVPFSLTAKSQRAKNFEFQSFNPLSSI